jgi:hypothetical protein
VTQPKRLRRRICHICNQSFQPPDGYYGGFCEQHRDDVRRREAQRVLTAILRAQQHGTPATLTTDEWISTLDHWKWSCAYCGGPYQVIEHVCELKQGGGSTKGNVVPSCLKCNATKRNYRKGNSQEQHIFQNALARIEQFLSPFMKEIDAPFIEDEDDIDDPSKLEDQTHQMPIQSRTLSFAGTKVSLALLEDGEIYFGVRRLCVFLAIRYSGQVARINGKGALFSQHTQRVMMPSDQGPHISLAMNLKVIETWLRSLSDAKISQQTQETIAILLQTHTFHFPFPTELTSGQIYEALIQHLIAKSDQVISLLKADLRGNADQYPQYGKG